MNIHATPSCRQAPAWKLHANHPSVLLLKIIGGWVSIILMVDIVVVPCFLLRVAGEGQSLSGFLLTSGRIAVDGVFFMSVVMTILYFQRFKKFWIANTFFILMLGILFFNGHGSVVWKRLYDPHRNSVSRQSSWKNGGKVSAWAGMTNSSSTFPN